MHELDEYCEKIEFKLSQADAKALGLNQHSDHSKPPIATILIFALLVIFFC
ncbi:hypothetical protein PTW35_10140 [Photobacterium sp. DA100]|uniref:hypothetical protein n=1 Tax=Photobacterium sp. DA100 TaxID=3027472 RepID=UPI00247A1C65|nr:hypothetical protein [Photobacterium sp. DA100]WEM41004.1 hypothetical protein PTW35_10140 [Photobacterium sp. DA100]